MDIKMFGTEQSNSGSIMVTQKNYGALFPHQFNTLVGIRSITNNIAKAHNLINALSLNIGYHRLQRFKITVNI
jgi:hypothetical protein